MEKPLTLHERASYYVAMSVRRQIAEIIAEETTAAGARAAQRVEALLVGQEPTPTVDPGPVARHTVAGVKEAILEALRASGQPLPFREIRVRSAARASDVTVRAALAELRDAGTVVMDGERSTATYRLA